MAAESRHVLRRAIRSRPAWAVAAAVLALAFLAGWNYYKGGPERAYNILVCEEIRETTESASELVDDIESSGRALKRAEAWNDVDAGSRAFRDNAESRTNRRRALDDLSDRLSALEVPPSREPFHEGIVEELQEAGAKGEGFNTVHRGLAVRFTTVNDFDCPDDVNDLLILAGAD